MGALWNIERSLRQGARELEQACGGSDQWRDEQRAALQRVRIEPLVAAAQRLAGAVHDVSAVIEEAAAAIRRSA